MTQTITTLGEIGSAGPSPAGLTPLDLSILRDGATWDLTGYTDPAIDVWDLRTRAKIATPGPATIEDAATGTMRWVPVYANFPSGSYEARFRVSKDAGATFEGSGFFRFSIGAAENG